MKTKEEIEKELEDAKKQADIDTNRRKIMYADVEAAIIAQEKKLEAVKLFCGLVQKYSISGEDIVVLLENIPYL